MWKSSCFSNYFHSSRASILFLWHCLLVLLYLTLLLLFCCLPSYVLVQLFEVILKQSVNLVALSAHFDTTVQYIIAISDYELLLPLNRGPIGGRTPLLLFGLWSWRLKRIKSNIFLKTSDKLDSARYSFDVILWNSVNIWSINLRKGWICFINFCKNIGFGTSFIHYDLFLSSWWFKMLLKYRIC